MKITLAEKIYWTKYNLVYPELGDIIQMIRTGNIQLHDNEFNGYTLKRAIEHIRSVAPSDMQKWKARLLPAVAYNGTFRELNSAGLIEYSCVTALDFDHIATPYDMYSLENRLKITPCVLSVFITPSGRGLKALIWHDNTDPARHGDLYEQLLNKFYVANGSDASCKDLARRNYLSYDPYIWINPSPDPYHYVPTIKPQVQIPQSSGTRTVSDKSIISIMNSHWKKNNPEYWKKGNRANSIFMLACRMCKWGVDEGLVTEYFIDGWEDDTMDEKEIRSHVGNAYKAEEKNFGTLIFTIH